MPIIKLEISGLELLCQAAKLSAYCTIKCPPCYLCSYRAYADSDTICSLASGPAGLLLGLSVPPSQRKCLLPPASSLSCKAASSRLQGCICRHLCFPSILSLHLSWLPNFRCCTVRVSQACIYVEQGHLCRII